MRADLALGGIAVVNEGALPRGDDVMPLRRLAERHDLHVRAAIVRRHLPEMSRLCAYGEHRLGQATVTIEIEIGALAPTPLADIVSAEAGDVRTAAIAIAVGQSRQRSATAQ